MLRHTRRARTPFVFLFRLLVAVASSTTLLAGARADDPVVIAEVSTNVGHEEVVPVMRSSLATELSTVKIPPGKKIIVSAALTKFETKGTTTSCVISLALRDADGTLKGVVSGTGAVVGKRDANATKEAVDAAVRGATKGVPAVVGS